MRVDQLIPAYHRGDAIGDTASHMKEFFLSQGFQSDIYCLSRDQDLEAESRSLDDFLVPAPSDVTIYHFALPSVITPAFVKLPSRKVIIYHNITPEKFFWEFNPEMARLTRLGREELKSLVPHVELALADSEFNRKELQELGFAHCEVFPLFIDFNKYQKPVSQFLYEFFKDGRTNILFVGRVVPNKKIEELIKVVFYYKKYISPLVRLIVVGKTNSLPNYYESLIQLADEFYLDPQEICFTGHISDEEMFALYRAADVFLSMSEHEGFGLPFVESMIFSLPIVAFNCTAVPYTLMDAGILINHKQIDMVAELVNKVAYDEDLRAKVVKMQKNQLEIYKKRDLQNILLKIITV
jgi:glycosyltransferase involved in cell wall biosynthesis